MPTRSKAAILVEPNAPLVIDDVTLPDPQPDQVLLKLFASGICHSQLQRTYTGTRGSLCRPDRDFPIFVRWFQRGQLDLDALVTQRYTLEKINDATADLAGGRIHGRSIITYT
jgi:Zn-dependent alcohol dehydrogenase